MNDEKSNCMVLKKKKQKKQKRKHHETNNRWMGEGEELQMERFHKRRKRNQESQARALGQNSSPAFAGWFV